MYRAVIPVGAGGDDDFEYFVRARLDARRAVYWPPGAPQRAQTVVVGGPVDIAPWGAPNSPRAA